MRTQSLQIRTPEGIVFSQLLAGQCVQSLDGCYVVVVLACLATIQKLLKARLQVGVNVPYHLKEALRHVQLIAPFNRVAAIGAACHRDLPFGCQPEVHPQWQVHKDD